MDYSLLLAVHFKGPSRSPSQRSDHGCSFPLHEMTSSRFEENSGNFLVVNPQPFMFPCIDPLCVAHNVMECEMPANNWQFCR
jgi:hypothetical protein